MWCGVNAVDGLDDVVEVGEREEGGMSNGWGGMRD